MIQLVSAHFLLIKWALFGLEMSVRPKYTADHYWKMPKHRNPLRKAGEQLLNNANYCYCLNYDYEFANRP